MKKLVLLTAFILLSGFTFGQGLQKGNLVGTHVMTITLQPGVTMEKYLEYVRIKLIPEIEKNYPGWKAYIVKSIRGEVKNSFGLIYVIKSEKDRDKYYNADESYSELGNTVFEKLKPVMDELGKLGTLTTTYTDWVVQ